MKSKYTVIPTNQFKKDLKAAKKRNLNMDLIESVIISLAEGKVLEPKHKDHALKG